MTFGIGYLAAIAAILAYVVWGLRRLKRDMPIDMSMLTDDPATATVDETLTRLQRFNTHADVSLQVATCQCSKCRPS